MSGVQRDLPDALSRFVPTPIASGILARTGLQGWHFGEIMRVSAIMLRDCPASELGQPLRGIKICTHHGQEITVDPSDSSFFRVKPLCRNCAWSSHFATSMPRVVAWGVQGAP